MINQQLSEIFNNMASYLEMQSDTKAFFRSRAFKKAAEVISKLPFDLSSPEWHQDIEKMKKLKGIGDRIAKHINEYATKGKITEYEELKEQSPVKLEELLKIQGVGPKKILKLYKELGVTNIESLKQAVEEDKISQLDGFGPKSQENIAESIKFAILNKDRILISTAELEKEELLSYMQKDKNIQKLEFGGSLRRKKETVGDLDILVSTKNPEATSKHFISYPKTKKILGNGETKSSIWLKSKIQVDMRVVDLGNFGAALQYFTGSKEHNVKLRNIAIKKGYKLSEYGLFKRDNTKDNKEGEKVAGENEKEIYETLGLQYIPPELREYIEEFELAETNKLPDLINLKDIKGDLHMHTTWSDGKNTIKEMAQECIKLGYEYMGITDHFGKLAIAGAISDEDFDKYLQDIRSVGADCIRLHNTNPIKILAGAEVDIAKDGSLEFNEDKLKQLDYVIASVHLNTKMEKEEMTKRIIKALSNPLVKILAHPTGRLILQRPGYEFDYKEVFKVAKEENVALEINAHPVRLDLRDDLVHLALQMGCKIVINTDSHSTSHLYYMKYGINVARRGYVEKKNLFVPPVS